MIFYITIWDQHEGSPHDNRFRFFSYVVLANYVDFLEAFEDQVLDIHLITRKAWNSAIALYHFREHLSPTPSFDETCVKCAEYSVLRDLVTTVKHGRAKVSKSGLNKVGFTVGIRAIHRPEPDIYVTEFTIPLSGTTFPLEKVLEGVIDHWITELNLLGGAPMMRSELVISFRESRAK